MVLGILKTELMFLGIDLLSAVESFFSLKRRVWVVRESFFSYGYNSNEQKVALPNHAANCITTCGVQEILQI